MLNQAFIYKTRALNELKNKIKQMENLDNKKLG